MGALDLPVRGTGRRCLLATEVYGAAPEVQSERRWTPLAAAASLPLPPPGLRPPDRKPRDLQQQDGLPGLLRLCPRAAPEAGDRRLQGLHGGEAEGAGRALRL